MGPEHPATLRLMHNTGMLVMGQRKHAEAEALLAEAWNGRARLLGPDHPDTMLSAQSLGESYLRLGRATEAEPPVQR
jgi:hypothetical protein